MLLKWLSKSIVSRVTKKSNLLFNFLFIYVKVEIWEQEENLLCIVSYKQGKSSVYLYKGRSQTKYNMVMRNTKRTNKKPDLISKYRKSKFLQFSMAQYPHSKNEGNNSTLSLIFVFSNFLCHKRLPKIGWLKHTNLTFLAP